MAKASGLMLRELLQFLRVRKDLVLGLQDPAGLEGLVRIEQPAGLDPDAVLDHVGVHLGVLVHQSVVGTSEHE